jgi:hypothetical protein
MKSTNTDTLSKTWGEFTNDLIVVMVALGTHIKQVDKE